MGNQFQTLRRKYGYSQATLAEATGIPSGTIKGWEQGQRGEQHWLFLARLRVVAQTLGISLEELADIVTQTQDQ